MSEILVKPLLVDSGTPVACYASRLFGLLCSLICIGLLIKPIEF